MEFGFDDLRNCKDFKSIVGGMVGYIPRSIEDRALLRTLDVGWLQFYSC